MAEYPTGVKSFTTKLDGSGNTIFAAHPNAMQDEITAIENALLSTGFAHSLIFAADSAYNIGSSTVRPATIYADDVNAGATVLAATAFILGAATTAGVRADLESGVLAVREGDDSAYAGLKALTLEATTTATIGTSASIGTTATIGTAVIVGAATTSGIRLDLNSGTLEVREGDDSAYGPVNAGAFGTLAGGSSTLARVGGTFAQSVTAVGNVGTGDDDLHTHTLAAGLFAADGQRVIFEGWGLFAANGNNKRVRLKLTGAGIGTVLDTGTVTYNNVPFYFRLEVTRTGASAQLLQGTLTPNGQAAIISRLTAAEVHASQILIVSVTGEGAATDDIIVHQSRVTWVPA